MLEKLLFKHRHDPEVKAFALSEFNKEMITCSEVARRVQQRFGITIYSETIASWIRKAYPEINLQKRWHQIERRIPSDRICELCSSNWTQESSKGLPHWVKYDCGFICKKCYQRMRRRQKKQVVERRISMPILGKFKHKYKRNPATIKSRATQNRYHSKIPNDVEAVVKDLLIQGYNNHQIARKIYEQTAYPIWPQTAAKIARFWGINNRLASHRNADPQIMRFTLMMFDQGYTISNIQRLIKVNYGKDQALSTISKWVKRFKSSIKDNNVHYRRHNMEAIKYAIECIRNDTNYADTARLVTERFGKYVHPITVRGWYMEFDKEKRVPIGFGCKYPAEVIKRICELLPVKRNVDIGKALSREFGVYISQWYVSMWRRKFQVL